MENKWMALAIILIVATAGLAIGFVTLYFQSQQGFQQVVPIPITETETVQTGTNTHSQYLWSVGSAGTSAFSEAWYPMCEPFYDVADWYFYIDDNDNTNTYYLEFKVVNSSLQDEKVILPNTSFTGDSKIILNATQRIDSYYHEPDGRLAVIFEPISGYTVLTCYLRFDTPILENVTRTRWLFIPI